MIATGVSTYWANILSFLTVTGLIGGILASPLKRPFIAIGHRIADAMETRLRAVIKEEVAGATGPLTEALNDINDRLTLVESQLPKEPAL